MGMLCSRNDSTAITADSPDNNDHNHQILRLRAPSILRHGLPFQHTPDELQGSDGLLSNQTIRIGLLGSRESGKTTLFEQIRKLSNNSPTQSELRLRKSFIYDNIVNSMARILENIKKQKGVSLGENEKHVATVFHYEQIGDTIDRLDRTSGEPLDERECEALIALWKDPIVQHFYTRRAEFSLNDSAKYFFDNLSRIGESEYEPTHEDVIRAYIPTVGVQEMSFPVNKRNFQVFDFGGSNVDAQKWSNFYDGICALIFCLAISTYDQNNRNYNEAGEFKNTVSKESEFVESYRLLAKICKKEKFLDAPIYVFLNETDIFQAKFDVTAFSIIFPGFAGDSPEDAMEFMKKLVVERCVAEAGPATSHRLHFYSTCLINTKTTAKTLVRVFEDISAKK